METSEILNTVPFLFSSANYSDSQCKLEVGLIGCGQPTIAFRYTTGCDTRATEIYKLGAPIQGTTYYTKDGNGTCIARILPSAYALCPLGATVDASTFPLFTIKVD